MVAAAAGGAFGHGRVPGAAPAQWQRRQYRYLLRPAPPGLQHRYAAADGPGRAALPLPLDTTALPGLSARSWQLARAYQLGPALQQLGQLGRGGPASPTYPAFLQQRQALVRQLERTMDEVLRVEEELSCDQQRTDQAAVGLDRLTTTRRNNLTVGSLLAGAASGTVSATLTSDRAATLNLVLTVSTAAVSAALGLATLFVNPKLDYPCRATCWPRCGTSTRTRPCTRPASGPR